MQSLAIELADSRYSDEHNKFACAVRASELTRKLAPIMEACEIRLRLVTLWGPIAAGFLLIAIPAGGVRLQSIATPIQEWFMSQSATVQNYWSLLEPSFTGTTLFVGLVLMVVIASDLLTAHKSRRQQA